MPPKKLCEDITAFSKLPCYNCILIPKCLIHFKEFHGVVLENNSYLTEGDISRRDSYVFHNIYVPFSCEVLKEHIYEFYNISAEKLKVKIYFLHLCGIDV